MLRLPHQFQHLLPARRRALRRDGRFGRVLSSDAEDGSLAMRETVETDLRAAVEDLGGVENAPRGVLEGGEELDGPTRGFAAPRLLESHRPDVVLVVVRRELRHNAPQTHHRRAVHLQRQLHRPQELAALREERLGLPRGGARGGEGGEGDGASDELGEAREGAGRGGGRGAGEIDERGGGEGSGAGTEGGEPGRRERVGKEIDGGGGVGETGSDRKVLVSLPEDLLDEVDADGEETAMASERDGDATRLVGDEHADLGGQLVDGREHGEGLVLLEEPQHRVDPLQHV